MKNNIEETPSFLQGLTLNDKLIAATYLDFTIYFYFIISLSLFFAVFFMKKAPFDNLLIKRVVLGIVSIIGFLLFFKLYFYMLLLLIITIWLSLWKVREEISQYFLIKHYSKKDLNITISEELTTKIIVGKDADENELYNKIWLIQFFNQLFWIFTWIKDIILAKNKILWIYLKLIFIFSFLSSLLGFYLFLELFETKYIFISK